MEATKPTITTLKSTMEKYLEEALQSSDKVMHFHHALKKLLEEGNTSSEDLLTELEQFQLQLRSLQKEQEEELIMDMISFLIGWCSPHMKLPWISKEK